MLKSLSIKNIAVIDHAVIDFERGFSVLTGETAAGKSLIIDSINMVLGERSNKDLVRRGCDKATVEALFGIEPQSEELKTALDELGIEYDDELVIRREITSAGKASCRINGQMVTASMLRDISKNLVNIHGQQDSQALLCVGKHIDFLDKFADIKEEVLNYKKVYKEYQNTGERLETLRERDEDKFRRIDLLNFQRKEIEEARLTIGEDDECDKNRKRLSGAAKIAGAVGQACEELYSGENCLHDVLAAIIKNLESAAEYDDELLPMSARLGNALVELDEAAHALRDYQNNIEFNDNELEFLEERLNTISDLKRKYAPTIEQILQQYDEICKELSSIENNEQEIAKLTAHLADVERALREAAEKLHTRRAVAAQTLDELITRQLSELSMSNAIFRTQIEQGDWGVKGCDRVEFLISTNAGEELRPLVKIASGGELSRIMLAIKSVLSDADEVDTLIFDEIDTGVSGNAAHRVGQKISKIAQKKQVICVTHLAQIACLANNHYFISKKTQNSQTITKVEKLSLDARTHELARIIGGAQITELTLQNAKEMLEMAQSGV